MNARIATMTRVWVTVALLAGWPAVARATDGSIVAWGSNSDGQCNVPAPNSDFIAVAADGWDSLGLKADGSIVAWGLNSSGQCNVPAPNSDFVAVEGGEFHGLGLKAGGSIVAWGNNLSAQCNVPAPNSDFIAVAGGWYHSLGVKADGSIVAWGQNTYGQCDVPAPNADFVAVAGGLGHSLGLKADGSIVGWGWNGNGQCNVPAPNSDFIAVAGASYHTLGLKAGGGAENQPPVAAADGPYAGYTFSEIQLDGSNSYDPDGTIAEYDWRFNGEWHNDLGATPITVGDQQGTYTIELRVHDNYGDLDTDTTTLTLSHNPDQQPTAFIDSVLPSPAAEAVPVDFYGHGTDVRGVEFIVGYNWRSSIDGQLSTEALFSTTLSVGVHTIYFKVKNNNDIWSDEVPYTFLVSDQDVAYRWIVEPPYKEAGCGEDYTGGAGLLAATYSDCSVQNGALCSIASAGVVGGVFSEAWQFLSFSIHRTKLVGFEGELRYVGGGISTGPAGFASTAKVWWIDEDHNGQWDASERGKEYIDPPLTPEDAITRIIEIALLIVPGVPPTLSNAFALFSEASYGQLAAQLYSEDMTAISFSFVADEGINRVGMGIRTQASGCLLGTGIAVMGTQLNKIKIWGIYPPGAPILTGPDEAMLHVGEPYDFSATAWDVNWADEIRYDFDWGTGTYQGSWTAYVGNNEPVTVSHTFNEPGAYTIKARAWDGDSIFVLGAQVDMISEDSPPYAVLVGEPGAVAVTAYCPVDLIVTDPAGRTVTKETSEIPDSMYVETDLDGDEHADDWVYIPAALEGTYTIAVEPEAGADPTETFTIVMFYDDQRYVLAEDVAIADIPDEPYSMLVDATPPQIMCPPDAAIECEQSTDPSSTGMASATDNCDPDPVVDFSDSVAPGSCAQESVITRIWTATDEADNSSSCDQVITVVDTTPPVVDCSVTTDVLWAPDHHLEAVGLATTVSDNCDQAGAEDSLIVQVWSDETEIPDTGDGTGRHAPDAKDICAGLRLRKERRGAEDGRVYLIIARAEDACGNVGFGYSAVVVPHDQSEEGLAEVAAQAEAALATVEATTAETIAEKVSGLVSEGWTQHGISEELGPHQ